MKNSAPNDMKTNQTRKKKKCLLCGLSIILVQQPLFSFFIFTFTRDVSIVNLYVSRPITTWIKTDIAMLPAPTSTFLGKATHRTVEKKILLVEKKAKKGEEEE